MMPSQDGNSPRDAVHRRPEEDWREYMERLEKARLEAIASHRMKEAEALESVIGDAAPVLDGNEEQTHDVAIRIEARAKRAYAAEFFRAIEEMENGASQ